jgi:hypothetical protein
LPGNAELTVLFSSTVAFGPRAAPHYRCFWFDIALETASAGNTVQLQKSGDGGVTWVNAEAATAIGAGHTVTELYVAPYADWRVLYTNGATPQTVFNVDMGIDHTSRPKIAP